MGEAALALFAFGQQLLQQQQPSGEQPTVCVAMVPLLIPATLIAAHTIVRKIRRLSSRTA